MSRHRRAVRALSVLVPIAALTFEAAGDIPLVARRVATGLVRPVFVTAPPGDTSRLFIVEQHSGLIKILNLTGPSAGTINTTPFLDLDGQSTADEQGLLGMAFHPDYANNGQFYIHFTAPGGAFSGGQINVRRYTRSATDPNVANAQSAQSVIRFDHPQSNHNAGWIGFGPRDGYLYISSGDGGNGNDVGTGHIEPGGNAQNTTSLLGKMLRLDVNGDDFPADSIRNYSIPRGGAGQPPANPFSAPGNTGADEIWHFGLRNPWRASFDRVTGDMYIGDVGQGAREEIDYQPGNSAGGLNYGWRLREGKIATPSGGVGGNPPPGNVDPIHDYDRTIGTTVTGGYVYRGPENPALEGRYFFADYGSGRMWYFKYDGQSLTKFAQLTIPADVGSISSVSSFGEDALGRLYVTDLFGGEVFRLVPPVPGDANLNRVVDNADFMLLYNNFGTAAGKTWRQGDFNDDGLVNFVDFQILERAFGQPVAFGTLPDGTPVPEPAVGVLAVLGCVMLGRRRG
jgi:glucose/arabinose dehydrogenase